MEGVVIGSGGVNVRSCISFIVRFDVRCNLCPGIEVRLAYSRGGVCEGLRGGGTSEEQGEDREPYDKPGMLLLAVLQA